MLDTPEAIEKLTTAIVQAKADLEFLHSCKESNQPEGKKLNTLLVDAYANLANACENLTDLYDYLAKDLRTY